MSAPDDADTTDSWETSGSGPFCRHWSDPSDCHEKCAKCGHLCKDHWLCEERGCSCEEFVDEE